MSGGNKIMSSKLIAVILLLIIPLLSISGVGDWHAMTGMHGAQDIVFSNGMIWCATTGGLAGFDLSEGYFDTYTHLDGLDGTGLYNLALDSVGSIWIILEKRSLQRFDPVNRRITHTVSPVREVNSINDMVIDQRGIYLATNVGIAKVKYFPDQDEWFWFERYTKLGTFPDQEAVTAVVIQGDFIWAGTAEGLARGDLNTPAPLTWTNYSTDNGLSGNEIRDVVVLGNHIYCATDGGTSEWDGSTWVTVSNKNDINKLIVQGDNLYAITQNGLFNWDGSNWVLVGEERQWITSSAVDNEGNTWIGLTSNNQSAGGISELSNGSWQASYLPNSPTLNNAKAFAFTDDGALLMVGGRIPGELGLNRRDGGIWRNWSRPEKTEDAFGYPSISVTVDYDNGVWLGTFGGGIANFVFNYDGSIDTILFYDDSERTGGRLAHNSDHSSMVITAAVTTDDEGNVWVANRGASDGNVLVCIPRNFIQNRDPETEWHYFHRSLFSNFDDFDLIAVDGDGRKWLTSTATSGSGRGVYVFDDNGTLDDSTDDRSWGPVSGLNQQQANCLAWDPAGYIWAGMIDGAYYIFTDVPNLEGQGFTQFYYARDEPINAITVDPAHNKWLGTNHGIMIVAPDLFTVTERITADLPYFLPDSVITTIAVDPRDGWAYIGTNNGSVSMRTPYRDFGETIESVTIEPNPFNPNLGRMYFTGSSLANGASARIYTPDGRLVRKLSHLEAGHGWDGRDKNGRKVASGIYLILTYNGQSQAGQGKVAVIWK